MSSLMPDGMTRKGKVYGSECNCGHRIGVHFIDLKTHREECAGYGDKECNCTKYEKPKLGSDSQ